MNAADPQLHAAQECLRARALDRQAAALLGHEVKRWTPAPVRALGEAAQAAGGEPARLWAEAEAIRWGLALVVVGLALVWWGL